MATVIRPFEPSDETEVRRVMEAALAVDRYPGFDAWELEQELVSIVGFAGGPMAARLAFEDGGLCGYVSPRHDDLTVHPEFRRRGHGRRLLAAGLELVAAAGEAEISLYAPADGPGRSFAEAMGMRHTSSLWRMDLPSDVEVPAPAFPEDVVARPYGDWLPIERLVAVMNDCFASHPTPVSWTVEAVVHSQAQPGFDTDGTLLLCSAGAEGEPIGFARAVLGPEESGPSGRAGEVRAIGVMPDWRGRGLGRELLRWGVARLRSQGVALVHLTVEAQNERALGLYERTGFVRAIEWPHWTLPVATKVPGL
jgi:mycothiol synthase